MTNRMLLALLFAPLAASCGSHHATTTTTANSPENPATAAYAYARCMRSHGVPNFPDPQVRSSPGHASVAFAVTPSQTGSPKFKGADKVCSRILPQPTNPSPAQQRAHKQDLLAFARCLRTHGIHGFPDPDAQGRLTLQTVSAAGVDIHARKFLDAAKACVGVSGGAVTLPAIEAAVSGQG